MPLAWIGGGRGCFVWSFQQTKGTACAVPPAYGVIIKLSRVETLFNQASVFGVHHDRSSFSSCNRRGGTEVAGTGVALHQAGLFAGIDKALSPAGNGSIVVVQLAGGAGSTESLGQQGGGLLTGDLRVGIELALVVTSGNVLLVQVSDGP